MSSNAIVFDKVTKSFSRQIGLLKLRRFLDRLQNRKKILPEEDFVALADLSFTVKHGERVGILGRNGAGKTTLLRLVNQVMFPTTGKVTVNGSVGGLMEVNTGFENELSGKDNVYLICAILGFKKRAIDALYPKILDMSGLQDFINTPVKKYSSGMRSKLGFAIVMETQPDIVLLDESLAVGDAKFKEKSLALLHDYLKGRTVLFVSHSVKQVESVCERVIVIHNTKMIYDGPIAEGIKMYQDVMQIDPHSLVEEDDDADLLVQAKPKRRRKLTKVPREITKPAAIKVSDIATNGEADNPFLFKQSCIALHVKFELLEPHEESIIHFKIMKMDEDGFELLLDEKKMSVHLSYENNQVKITFKTTHLPPGSYSLVIEPRVNDNEKEITRYERKIRIADKTTPEHNTVLINTDIKMEMPRLALEQI